MKIIERYGSKRSEDRYQVEDWSGDFDIERFPNLRSMLFCVGCYVLANEKYPYFPAWTRFRVCINFETIEEANDCFRNLIEGKKQIVDYKENVYQPEKLAWIR